jgi:RNA polymerase sigma-54 factor
MTHLAARARPTSSTRISSQLIMRYEMLRLPSHELAAHLRDMSYTNPLLEVVEHSMCPRCGQELSARKPQCQNCRSTIEEGFHLPTSSASADDEERSSWLEGISVARTLSEEMWLQCLESGLDKPQLRIAYQLICDLDEHGYLGTDAATHAEDLDVSVGEVERVRQRLMQLEPIGVGSRGPKECLMAQANALSNSVAWAETARRLLTEQWNALVEGEVRQAARGLGLPFSQVEQAFRMVLQRFYLYPAYGCKGRDTETVILQPDVCFTVTGSGARTTVQVDVLESRRYSIGINPEYRELIRSQAGQSNGTHEKMVGWTTEVKRVASALRQRWHTLQQVCESIAEFQREFFASDGSYDASLLRPLTRDEIANALGVHPSTVGRAVNGKNAVLPNRRIVPLSIFFDSSAPVQALIAQLVASEETTLLSDETLRRHLHRAGWTMTRRAVSLHRESMGILPTHLRRRQRRMQTAMQN